MFISPSDTIFVYMSAFTLPFLVAKKFFGLKQRDISVSPETEYSGQYGDLRNADPNASYTYHMGPFESFLNTLGFRTKFDTQKESLALASNAYQADVTQKQYDEAYDSPVAQADRMRQAGLNPDLLGTSGVQSAAAMTSEDNPQAAVSEPDFMASPGNFAGFIMTSLTTAVGLAKDFKSLQSINLANESQSIGNAEGLLNLAFDAILNYTPAIRDLDIGDETNPDGSVNSLPFDPAYIQNRIATDYKGAMSKKQYQSFMANVSNMIDGLPVEKELYKQWRERAEHRRGYFRETTRPDYSESDEIIYGVSQMLSDLAYKSEKLGLENDVDEQNVRTEHLTNQMEYEKAIDPELQAESENASNRYNVQNKDTAILLESSLNEIMHYLKQKSESGNRLASIALAIISLGRLMNVSMTSGPKGASFGFGM